MKRTLVLLAAGALFFTSCQQDPQADQAKTGEAMEASATTGTAYPVDLAQSQLTWIGTKPTGQHMGATMLKSGNVVIQDGNITGGQFVMDMADMKSLDQDTSGAYKLIGHLQSADFFDVAQFPTSKFEITSVTAGVDTAGLVMKDATHTITGNLTLKDVTKSVTFPARIAMSENSVLADANFNIDRTQWGISYGNDQSLKDKFIRPIVNIGLHIVAVK